MNPFALSLNSFYGNTFSSYVFIVTIERIKTKSKGIHAGFWPGLNPGINVIIILLI